MESDEAKWLKRVYSEAPKEGPCAKVKFSVVQGEIGNRFAPTSYTAYAVSQVIHEAFPNSESKLTGSYDRNTTLEYKHLVHQVVMSHSY